MSSGHNTAHSGAADLAAARDALLAGTSRNRRLDTPALRHALVDLHEFWLTTKGAELGIKHDCGFAIVAVGGLGRREMLPYSDLDLILLHDDMDSAVVSQVADKLWYPLWDAHIKLDHSVRTVPQALQVFSSDLTAALGMLEARHIAGDVELSNLLIGGVRRQWRTGIRSRFDEVELARAAVDGCAALLATWGVSQIPVLDNGQSVGGLIEGTLMMRALAQPAPGGDEGHRRALHTRRDARRRVAPRAPLP